MTRYEKIVRTVFPNGEIKFDIELFKSIINDLNPDDEYSIQMFRNLVTIYVHDIRYNNDYDYKQVCDIDECMNHKLRSVIDKDIIELYDYCIKCRKYTLWNRDEMYKAFAYRIKQENKSYLLKPAYVMTMFKNALYLKYYQDICKNLTTLDTIRTLHILLHGSLIDEYVKGCFDYHRSMTENINNFIEEDKWLDLILTGDLKQAYRTIFERTEKYKSLRNETSIIFK